MSPRRSRSQVARIPFWSISVSAMVGRITGVRQAVRIAQLGRSCRRERRASTAERRVVAPRAPAASWNCRSSTMRSECSRSRTVRSVAVGHAQLRVSCRSCAALLGRSPLVVQLDCPAPNGQRGILIDRGRVRVRGRPSVSILTRCTTAIAPTRTRSSWARGRGRACATSLVRALRLRGPRGVSGGGTPASALPLVPRDNSTPISWGSAAL